MQESSPQIEIVNAFDLIHSEVVGGRQLFDIGGIDNLAKHFHSITTSAGTKLREVPTEILRSLILEKRILVAHTRNAVGATLTENIVGVVRAENRGAKWEEFCGLHVREDFRGKELEADIAGETQVLPDYLFQFTNSPERKVKPTLGTLAEHLMLAGLKKIYHGDHKPLANPPEKSGAMLVTQARNHAMFRLAASFGLIPLDLDDAQEDRFDPEIIEVIKRSMQADSLKDMVLQGNRILMFDCLHLSPAMLELAKKYQKRFEENTQRRQAISRIIGRVIES